MIFDTYAARMRRLSEGDQPDVYSYDVLPAHLRHQIVIALGEGVGDYHPTQMGPGWAPPQANEIWLLVDRICRKELQSYMRVKYQPDVRIKVLTYLNDVIETNDFLSVVEIFCKILTGLSNDASNDPDARGAITPPLDTVMEINARFVQHSIGYQFENGEIIRVDSTLLHAEVVKPALALLQNPIFRRANEDFMTAHRLYRSGEYKDAVTSANRSFESMLKAICEIQKWPLNRGDRASDLITTVSEHGLFSHFFDKTFTAFVAMLKTGLPALRNDAGAHGSSAAAAEVTAEIARFAINMTATNIVFLAESFEKIKRPMAL